MNRPRSRLRSNSPEAVARVLAALLTEDGLLSAEEIDFMDRLGVYGIVGLTRDEFMRAVAGQPAGRHTGDTRWLEANLSRASRLDVALDAISNRDQQLVIAAVLLYIADADRDIREEERALIRRVLARWNIGAAELERELNVPRQRLRAFLEDTREQGVGS